MACHSLRGLLRGTPYLVACLLGVVLVPAVPFVSAGEIGFLERFALAADREKVLEELIPGTPDYYYFQCLHLQSIERFEQVDRLLADWIKRHGYTAQVHEIQHRQALLTYPQRPDASLAFLRRELNLQFNHQARLPGEKPQLPSRLDPLRIDRKTLAARALANYQNTDGFQPSAFDWLIGRPLTPKRRRHLLSRLQRPDYGGLVELIVADLKEKDSGGFGSLPIHGQLLQKQLDQTLAGLPALLNQQAFVDTYVHRLQPSNDIDRSRDPKAQEAYLERLEKFVTQLGPIHNSLKAHALYHRLQFDRHQGKYNEERLLSYLKLPRNVVYIHPDYVKRNEHRAFVADLTRNFDSVTRLKPVHSDESLVRDYLEHILVDRKNYDAYRPYLAEDWLKAVFAETKILHGKGDQESWYSLLPPPSYQQLKDRVDLKFAATNETTFGADQEVNLDLLVKNVDTLIVKVYEIHGANYYRRHQRQVDTDILLEGLRPNWETRHTYQEPSLRRVPRHFTFPQLAKPGVYVIDFIGGGQSSRAVIRKGELRYLARTSIAGQVLTVLSQDGELLKDARVWMAGHEYQADNEGQITIPFSTQGGQQPIVLLHDKLATLATLPHQTEKYRLEAAIYVDRESLIQHREAPIAIRPQLLLNGVSVSLDILKQVQLIIQTTDLEGINSRMVVKDVVLRPQQVTVHNVRIPAGLKLLSVTLEAQVPSISQNRDEALQSSARFELNSVLLSNHIEDLFLTQVDGRHWVEVRGRTGEPRSQRPVALSLRHRDYRDVVQVSLQSDAFGRIDLGSLVEIDEIVARTQEGLERRWQPATDQHWSPRTVHAVVGQTVRLPISNSAAAPARDQWSLLEIRGDHYATDHFDKLSIKQGMLLIEKLPRGDFELLDKRQHTHTRIRTTVGPIQAGYALGSSRYLQLGALQPMTIGSARLTDKDLQIQLENATPSTRVHVLATRFEPAYSPWLYLTRLGHSTLNTTARRTPLSSYLASRKIGDEYDYILQRQYRPKFAGNLLQRPQLLLNPWAISKTDTTRQPAAPGEPNAVVVEDSLRRAKSDSKAYGGKAGAKVPDTWLDFLADASVTLWNLAPDAKGRIQIPREQLGNHPQIHILALDPDSAVYRKLTVAAKPAATRVRDLRLSKTLDPKQHFTQRKIVQVAPPGKPLAISDASSSQFESYGSLAEVYELYSTLKPLPALAEFGFVLQWPKLTDAEKRDHYSRFASHELNLFLYHKDREFFRKTIALHLAQKKHKTFVDLWLLESKLDDYLSPWNYARLNTVERILLAQRIPDQQAPTQQHVRELLDLLPPDTTRLDVLFGTALAGKSLNVDAKQKKGSSVSSNSSRGREREERQMLRFDKNGAMKEARPESRRLLEDGPEDESLKSLRGIDANANGIAERDFARRKSIRQLYRKLDKTEEWVETHYYKLPLEQQNAELVTVNRFWNDYVRHDPRQPFVSPNLADASGNFTEIMLALAVLDLPFESPQHETQRKDQELTVTPGGPLVVFQEQIQPTDGKDSTPILLSENFFRAADRYRLEGSQKVDKFVRDEFLVQTVYGCQVVVTNPSSAQQTLSVLTQIPAGAIPVRGYQPTRSVTLTLEPFRTQAIEYYFYFPFAERFAHYGVHVAKEGKLVAHAQPFEFSVVEHPTRVDKTSWAYVSQQGTNQEVQDFLKVNNVQALQLNLIAFRMKDKGFFRATTRQLTARHKFDSVLWSYAVLHNEPQAIAEFLQHNDAFVGRCGEFLESPLLTIEPQERGTYEHRDYRPLVNARSHALGAQRQILNDRFFEQYQHLLRLLAYRRQLRDTDKLDVVYYLLLQDRVEAALQWFKQIDPEQLATRLQYDYFAAYTAFYQEDLATARQIATRYADCPISHWQKRFVNVLHQLDEIEGAPVDVADQKDRTQQQTQLAASQPSLDLKVEGKQIQLHYQNLKQVQINYYLLDLELLFSRNPFLQQPSGDFANIRANITQQVDLPAKRSALNLNLPAELHHANVLVEVQGAGQSASRIYFANSLKLELSENYGQLRVAESVKQRPLSKVYVKAYARMRDGTVRFYKDGYTDHRGRFDYSSLSTSELNQVQQFALLILSDDHGGLVREVQPPKQ